MVLRASRVPYLKRAEWTEGPDIRLSDAPVFCSHARFCVRGKGKWDAVERSGDPEMKLIALEMAANFHSGRLVIWDKHTQKPGRTSIREIHRGGGRARERDVGTPLGSRWNPPGICLIYVRSEKPHNIMQLWQIEE